MAGIDVVIKMLTLVRLAFVILVVVGITNARDCWISIDFLQQSYNLIGVCGLIDEVCGLFYTINVDISIGVGTVIKVCDFCSHCHVVMYIGICGKTTCQCNQYC